VTSSVEQILARLGHLGFQTRTGDFAPFGERVPLVSGTAWESGTAQLALVAVADPDTTDDEWRQLLFAGSALRHQLVGDGAAALGTPVILAVVDEAGRRRLRLLAEDLAQRYVVFSRVDLNLVLASDVDDPERLDDALAPLLPRCREALGQEISKGEVSRFWATLDQEVRRAADGLSSIFSDYRETVGREAAAALIGAAADAPDLPGPSPVSRIALRNLRSIGEAEIELAPVTILHGPNGSGKSTVIEALEIGWSGTSQRKPADVPVDEYARHLPRDGVGGFEVAIDDAAVVTEVVSKAHAELARCVLTHDAVAGLVSQSPEERYASLLSTTGLEIPDLTARTAALVEDAKRDADEALRLAGLPTLPRRDSQGERHLRDALKSNFASRLPPIHDIIGSESVLESTSDGRYRSRKWPTDQHAAATLALADTVIASLLSGSPELESIAAALDEAERRLRALAAPFQEQAQAIQVLLAAIERHQASALPAQERPAENVPMSVPPAIASRWLAHARSLSEAASEFRGAADRISDEAWAQRLLAYSAALEGAVEIAPMDDLAALARATPARETRPNPVAVADDLYANAGFASPLEDGGAVVAPLRELLTALQQHVAKLEVLARDVKGHPARGYAERSDSVLRSLCRFELARSLRREGPILAASETLVADLLKGRLAPIVRELVASIVRFEWYFKPLLIPQEGRRVVLGGLATSNENLDARLVLNSAERTALGLAWFMALHFLQPRERRRVLVMDDPLSVFDDSNRAGFVSTLRAFLRLARPEQVIVAAHDDAVASVLADELAPVDGWPTHTVRVRLHRDASDRTVSATDWSASESQSLEREAEALSLVSGEAASS
jgi:hypothetical protein